MGKCCAAAVVCLFCLAISACGAGASRTNQDASSTTSLVAARTFMQQVEHENSVWLADFSSTVAREGLKVADRDLADRLELGRSQIATYAWPASVSPLLPRFLSAIDALIAHYRAIAAAASLDQAATDQATIPVFARRAAQAEAPILKVLGISGYSRSSPSPVSSPQSTIDITATLGPSGFVTPTATTLPTPPWSPPQP